MKRMHVHVAVEDLQRSIGFYSALFATQPVVVKADYAKWMLDDPRVNFAISTRGKQPGLDHLGIQVESKDELGDVYARLRRAGGNGHRAGADDLLLCAVRKIVDRRSRGNLLGDVLHHRRKHRLRGKRGK
jgi:catechol 2,3-dioxygenase-like lactoylglutathione lyase family enzyme